MVKRAMVLLAVLLLLLSGCRQRRCDICGAPSSHRVKAIAVWYLCDGCYEDYLLSEGNEG